MRRLRKAEITDARAIKDGLVDLWTSLKTLQAALSDSSLKAIVPGEIELDVVAWLDASGNQKRKWDNEVDGDCVGAAQPVSALSRSQSYVYLLPVQRVPDRIHH